MKEKVHKGVKEEQLRCPGEPPSLRGDARIKKKVELEGFMVAPVVAPGPPREHARENLVTERKS